MQIQRHIQTISTGCQVVITPKYSNSIIYGLVTFNYWFATNADHNDYCVSTVYRNNSVNLASDQSLVHTDHANGSSTSMECCSWRIMHQIIGQ